MTSPLPENLEGKLVADPEARYAIVASRFNEFVVEELVRGAQNGLLRHGAKADKITVVRVPGAFEIPQVARRLAKSGKFDAIITCGAVIRGSTAHFDFVAGQAASGLASVSLESNVPVVFGILTTDTIEQAIERAGTKAGNKGFDAALTAIEMLSLGKTLANYGI